MAEAARGEGIAVVDLGRFELRNLTEAVELHELDCGLDARGHTIDPVCQMHVAHDGAAAHVRFEGVEYWLCSLECARRFTTSPADYVGSSAQPTADPTA